MTRFLFRNPHTVLFVESQGENGETIAWEIEMGTALSMSRRGWSPETIEVGDRIKAVGQPSTCAGHLRHVLCRVDACRREARFAPRG